MQTNFHPSRIIFFYCVIIITAIFLVYYPGLYGGFVLDDTSNILTPLGIRMQGLTWDDLKNAALSMEKRPIARASFGLNYLSTGFEAYYFKITNIVIHSLNSILVFFFVMLVVKQLPGMGESVNHRKKVIYLAAIVSAAWALHPVNVTNVLYIVQRMNSLSALFVLAGMVSYISGRIYLDNSPFKGWMLIFASMLIFLPLAWFSKENGALLPLFLFTIELTLFRFNTQRKSQKTALFLYHTVLVLLPLAFALVFILQHADQLLASYENRHFSLQERLLTEPRVMWLYIRMIVLPTPSLFGLFLDDIVISTSLTKPFSTTVAIFGLAGLLVIGLLAIKRAPVLAFGLLFFLAGHLIESTFVPLELAFEHRNYLPSIGLLLPLFYYILFGSATNNHIKARYGMIVIIILLFTSQTHFRARTWSNNANLYLTEVQYHPQSPRANYEAGKVFGQRLELGQGDPENNYTAAIYYFNRVTALQQSSTSGLFGNILASIDGKKNIQSAWIKEIEYRLSSRPLEQVNLLWLDKLTDCISQKQCREEDLLIPKLVNAAMNNGHANRRDKGMLSSILAKYMYQVEGNKEKTLQQARNAVSFRPSNLYYHLNLAKYLIWDNNFEEARKILLTAQQIDSQNKHTNEISSLLESLKTNK